MKVFGVIGSIGSGKSTISRKIFNLATKRGLNVQIINLDLVSKELFRTNEWVRDELVRNFGLIMNSSDIEARKKFVIEYIMINDVLYSRLMKIMSKYIVEYIDNKIDMYSKNNCDLVIMDGAQIIHSMELQNRCTHTILIGAPEGICKQRVRNRNNNYTDYQIDILYKRTTPDLNLNIDYSISTVNCTEYEEKLINSILDITHKQTSNIGNLRAQAAEVIQNTVSNNLLSPEVSVRKVSPQEVGNSINCDTTEVSVDKFLITHSPKVAVYPGSFNPFHVGHLAVVEDLLKVFDEVIILKCINGGKPHYEDLNLDLDKLPYRCNIEIWNKAFVDYIERYNEDEIVIARGIRNGADYDYETNYITHLKEQCKFRGIELPPVVFVPCRNEYRHISSSSIRAILPFDEAYARALII